MFYEALEKHAIETPAKIAVVEKSRTISYGELALLVNMFAANLAALGVTRGTKITVCMSNRIEYVGLYFAIARLGAVVIPLTTTLTKQEVETFCANSKSDFIVVEDAYREKFEFDEAGGIESTLISESTPDISLQDIFRENNSPYQGNEDLAEADFVIQYTSGTTGLPKGIVQTQRSHVNRMATWARTADLSNKDSTLCMLSLAHAYGADILSWPALTTGQTLYLLPVDDTDPARIAQLIDSEGITIFGSLPWFYKNLIETPNIEYFNLSSLRIAMCGATPLPKSVASEVFAKFNLRINNSYGLTETCLITSNLFTTGKEDMMSVGQLLYGVTHKIRDCGLGKPGVGELLVKSDAFATRYTEECGVELWQDGWIHTGDLVRRDEHGCFYILARLAEIITTAEGAILPFDIEEALMQLAGVAEVAVVPLDGSGGIFVVPSDDKLTEQQVRDFVGKLSPQGRHVKHIKFMESFPKSVTGKISKAKLYV